MSSAKNYITNVTAQVVGRCSTIVANFVIFVLIARMMGAEFLGQYSYILTFLGIFVISSEFGTTAILAKEIAQIKDSAENYLGNFLILRLGLSMFSIILAIISASFFKKDLYLYLAIGSLFLPFIASRFFEPIFQINKKPWFSTYPSVTYASFYLVLSLAALFFQPDLLTLLLAYLISNVIYAITAYYFASKLIKPRFVFSLAPLKKIMQLATPIGVASLFTIINSRADIFMLAYLKSDYDVGIYNTAYKFLDMAGIIAVMLMNPTIPIFSEKAINDPVGLKEVLMKTLELLSIIIIPAAIIIPYISPFFINQIFGETFLPSAEVLNILVWVGVLVFYSLISVSICVSIGVVHFGYWNTALAASVNIFLNYLWIPKYSFIGSAWATVISEILMVSVAFFYIIKHMGNIFNFKIWIKIIIANFALIAMLKTQYFGDFLTIIVSLIIYGLLIFIFKLIHKDLLTFIFKRKVSN